MNKNEHLADGAYVIMDRAIILSKNVQKIDLMTAAFVILKSRLYFENCYAFCLQEICTALGRSYTSRNCLYIKGLVEELMNHSEEYFNAKWSLYGGKKDLSKVGLNDYIKIYEIDKKKSKSFLKVYISEFNEIMTIPYKNKQYIFGIFCIITSSIFKRKPGDSKDDLPEACSLSMKQLEKYSGLSHATISIALKHLEQHGLISIIRYTSERVHKGVRSIVHHTNVYCRGNESEEAKKRLYLMLKGQARDDASKYLEENGEGDSYDEDSSEWGEPEPEMEIDSAENESEEFLEIADRERYEANELMRATTRDT